MVIGACMLLVFGAITKSAQFPFHTWLPLTLETPTPVSALMHAGIVNGGGYLMIRMSPLVGEVPWAMTTLAIFGAVTACYASVVMLTQTSVKNFLAYSTIAQMGFMILQCGLGAYPAAMLHIIAHSLYKAYAFLNSGSVIKERGSMRGVNVALLPPSFPKMLACGAVLASCLIGALTLLQIDITTKPGGLLLGFILCMALRIGWDKFCERAASAFSREPLRFRCWSALPMQSATGESISRLLRVYRRMPPRCRMGRCPCRRTRNYRTVCTAVAAHTSKTSRMVECVACARLKRILCGSLAASHV